MDAAIRHRQRGPVVLVLVIALVLEEAPVSVFTNPANRAAGEAAAYTAAVLRLLGERDPAGVLRQTAEALRQVLAGLPAGQETKPEARGKWSIRHVVQHLADSELVWGYRLRTVLADDRPRLTGYDQDGWSDRLGYDQVDAVDALADFAAFRQANLRLLGRIPAAAHDRVGVHSDRGEESVGHMMKLYAGHDLLHLRQVERIRRAVAGP